MRIISKPKRHGMFVDRRLETGGARRSPRSSVPFDAAIIGRPLARDKLALDHELKTYIRENGVSFTLERPSLVYLRKSITGDVLKRHGSDATRLHRNINSVGGHALRPLLVSRGSLDIIPMPSQPDERSFIVTSFPIRAYTKTDELKVNLHEEQGKVARVLGEPYPDEPKLWLGRIVGPHNTDAVEDVVDRLEDSLPLIMSLGRVSVVPE